MLREGGPQRASDIAARFAHLSRPAVSKHLRVLREAGLVGETAAGRERWYRLQPEPLEEIEAWLRRYRALWAKRLRALRQVVEQDLASPRSREEAAGAMRQVYPVITVRDVVETLRFYKEVLEFGEWFRWGGTADRPESVGLLHGEARLICDAAPPGGLPARAGAGVELYFDVGALDLDAYFDRVRRRGATVLEPPDTKPWGDRLFRIADPDGYRLAFARTVSGEQPAPPEGEGKGS